MLLKQSSRLPHFRPIIRTFMTPYRTSVETEFDKRWRKMSEAEQEKVRLDWQPIAESDWRNLTLDQKRALYTIEYGAPEIVDPYEKHKVVAGTAGVVISGIIAFAIIRSFAAPPPKTVAPEWQKAVEERAKLENMNPIYNPEKRY